jgi:hypothetical protein
MGSRQDHCLVGQFGATSRCQPYNAIEIVSWSDNGCESCGANHGHDARFQLLKPENR